MNRNRKEDLHEAALRAGFSVRDRGDKGPHAAAGRYVVMKDGAPRASRSTRLAAWEFAYDTLVAGQMRGERC